MHGSLHTNGVFPMAPVKPVVMPGVVDMYRLRRHAAFMSTRRDGHVLGCDLAMANSVRPWIVEYLLSVSEEYGAQIYKAPITQKSRVVQLVQVRRYPSHCILLRISLSLYVVPYLPIRKPTLDCMGHSIRQGAQSTNSADRGGHERIYVRLKILNV